MIAMRSGSKFSVGWLPLAATLGLQPSAARADITPQPGFIETPAYAVADFDGDGLADRVLGIPSHNRSTGAVVIVYGTGEVELLDRDTPGLLDAAMPGDALGDSLATGDIDGDGFDDLVVGVPGDDQAMQHAAGSIHVIYGSSEGLTDVGDQLFHRGTTGLDGSVDGAEKFGKAVAVGDFDCDGFADVAVGVPFSDFNARFTNDGAVQILLGSASGLHTRGDWIHRAFRGPGKVPAPHFGEVLAVGDFTGDGCGDLAFAGTNHHSLQGAVRLVYGAASGEFAVGQAQGLHQELESASGAGAEADLFGSQLWANDEDGDGADELIVGVPGEVCEDGRAYGLHRFRATKDGFLEGEDLADGWNSLSCVGWEDPVLVDAVAEYQRCVETRQPDCGATLQSHWFATDRGAAVGGIAACVAAVEFTVDACALWLEGKTEEPSACATAALELDFLEEGCRWPMDLERRQGG